MTKQQAKEIAALLNSRNQLAREYTAEQVLREYGNYVFQCEDGSVVACVEVKKVQWYQWEICHLSVREEYTRQGRGKQLIQLAEERASEGNARLVQCTIRVGNTASEEAFRRSGFRESCCFFNSKTENYVSVWQKTLSTRDLGN
jgi:N-acetylglutamate synthase-like GNAT family acetyltransferase